MQIIWIPAGARAAGQLLHVPHERLPADHRAAAGGPVLRLLPQPDLRGTVLDPKVTRFKLR